MINKVTERFIEVHNKILQMKKVKSSRQFAIMLDYLPQSLSEIINMRRDVSVELLRKAVEVFQMNPEYLFLGKGELFYQETVEKIREITLITNASGESKILYVPGSMQEKYALHIISEDIIKELPTFSLPDPNFNNEYYRCFEMKGDHMEPTIFEGERLVGRYLEPIFWKNSIKDNLVFIVVTNAEVYIGRLLNHLKETKSILVQSDNKFYKNISIKANDIQEIWRVSLKISPFLSSPRNPNEIFRYELQNIIQTNKMLTENIKDVEKQMRELLKRDSRTGTV